MLISVPVIRGALTLKHGRISYLYSKAPHVLAYIIFVSGSANIPGNLVSYEYLNSFIGRHRRNNGRQLVPLQLLKQSLGLNSYLNHVIVSTVPGNGIHHVPALRGIGSDILAHGHIPVGKHRHEV